MDFKKMVGLVKESIDPKIIRMFIVLIAMFLLIIVLLLLNTNNRVKTTANTLEALEKNLKNAAVRYFNKNKEKLPLISGEYKTITSDELISGGYLKSLTVSKLNKTCKGNVKVYQQSKNMYQYITYIDCGDINYSSKTLGKEVMKQNIETSNTKDGLYNMSSISKASSEKFIDFFKSFFIKNYFDIRLYI